MQSNVIQFMAPTWERPELEFLSGGGLAPAPAFPKQVLGDFWAEWCADVAASANAPFDYVGASLLTLAGALIGNARTAHVAGWSEPPVLWTVLIGNPSSGKSPAMDPFIDLLGRLQSATGERVQIDDASAAATAERAAEAPRGLLLVNDELSGWWSRMPQLGGEQFWLKAFGARAHSVDRKDKPTIHVRRLAVSVLGGSQPDAIRAFAASKNNRGFAARWLYIYPEPQRGFQLAGAANHVLAEDALRRLMSIGDGTSTEVCTLSAAARSLVEPWVGSKRRAASEHDGIWGEWLGKQGGVAMRLALIFEHLWWAAEAPLQAPPPAEISEDAYRAATAFIDDYAAPMAERALSMATRPKEEKAGARLAKLLQQAGVHAFNARDVRRGALGQAGELADAATMKLACETLETVGIIRHVGVRAGDRAGRAPANYEVNPRLLA